MKPSEKRDIFRLERLGELVESASSQPAGDVLTEAAAIYEDIEERAFRYVAEEAMRRIRPHASRAAITDQLFTDPPSLDREPTDLQYLQLMRIQLVTHELCYACEMVQASSDATWGGSTPTRLYLNSIYHYTSSLFLVDTSKDTHKNLPMGGTVIRALHPLKLEYLLDPIVQVLEESIGDTTYGDTILKLRHSDLVHGDFSPARVEYLVKQTEMRNPLQQEHFANLTWSMFHRLLILNLKLLALLNSTGLDPGEVALRYISDK